MRGEDVTLIAPEAAQFVETPHVRSTVDRALGYLACGLPVNFSGAAGTGKTTLALHVAAQLGQPVVLIHGDEQVGSRDLVGSTRGFRRRHVVDNFIHSVVKTEEDLSQQWVDSRLAVACRYGYTLVYDEFTRSRPEANNPLLSVLQERLLPLPAASGRSLVPVHPDFRAIFTSNPAEYAGVNRTQEALKDRMITLHMEDFDLETEAAITSRKSGLDGAAVRWVVELVRSVRWDIAIPVRPSVRAAIAIAQVLQARGLPADIADPGCRQVCLDVLGSQIPDAMIRAALPELLLSYETCRA